MNLTDNMMLRHYKEDIMRANGIIDEYNIRSKPLVVTLHEAIENKLIEMQDVSLKNKSNYGKHNIANRYFD